MHNLWLYATRSVDTLAVRSDCLDLLICEGHGPNTAIMNCWAYVSMVRGDPWKIYKGAKIFFCRRLTYLLNDLVFKNKSIVVCLQNINERPTFPTCGHILHWYFLPEDPFDGCVWIWPPLPVAPCAWPWPPLAALMGWGTTRPVWPEPLVAGGEDEAEELLLWPYRPPDICWASKPRSSRPENKIWKSDITDSIFFTWKF